MKEKRNDLQGLRALAVAGVVAYHFNLPLVPGGFVGVDVFFVLSGYFITRMLLAEAERSGNIDLSRFWANRVKRLLPNGLLVIAVTAIAAFALLPTYRSQATLADAVAAALFFSNFHFAAAAVDYFQLGAPPSPLLHFWSLAVEEQFYLVIPILLALATSAGRLATSRRLFVVTLAAIAIPSFVASIIEIQFDQPAAFYLTAFRAWQLATGGMVALLGTSRSFRHRAAGIGAWVGLALIIASYGILSDATIYPGYWALFPTVGTILLLLGLGGKWAGPLQKCFGWSPFVRLGDASYSIYLWHWPVIVILAAIAPEGGPIAFSIGIVLTALLSFLAYRYVERPIHKLPLPVIGLRRTYAFGAASLLLLVFGCLAAGALPGRTQQAVSEQIELASNDFGPNYADGCHREYEQIDQPTCLEGHAGQPRVVLFGDSHAAQWFSAVSRAASSSGWSFQSWTKTSCPAAQVTIWYEPKKTSYRECDEWRTNRIADLLSNPPDLLIIASSSRYQDWLYDPQTRTKATKDRAEAIWVDGVDRLVKTLSRVNLKTIQIVDTPEMNSDYRDCLSKEQWNMCGRVMSEALAGLPLAPSLPVIDLTDRLCNSKMTCQVIIDDTIAYRDRDHLTSSFAGSLYQEFTTLFGGSR